jgi:hypothetical protein
MKLRSYVPAVLGVALALPASTLLSAAPSSNRHLSPLPTGPARLSPPTRPDQFRFVVGGDNRPTGHGDPMPPSVAEICRGIGMLRPELVLWTGDTIHGYDDTPAEADQEYSEFLKLAGLCRVPFFNVPGNHEKGLDGAALEGVYLRRMGALYGSFDYGNSHFIGLDTTHLQASGGHVAELGAEQLEWLEEDLRAHSSAANTFVFMHHFVFGPPDPDLADKKDTGFAEIAMRDRLHRLFVQYGIRAVFCGHSHLYWHSVRDGVAYYIAGNAGAPLEAAPEAGGFLGYLLMEVNGREIRTHTIQPWTLVNRTVSGGDGRSPHAELRLSNYNHDDLPVRGITVRMPAAGAYHATATVSYKGQVNTVPVGVVRHRAETAGVEEVTLSLTLPHARTTRVLVDAIHP